MAWNGKRYGAGFDDANATIEERGLEAAEKEYAALEPPRSVNEYEVGYRVVLEYERQRQQER